jgi:hypothetical protein
VGTAAPAVIVLRTAFGSAARPTLVGFALVVAVLAAPARAETCTGVTGSGDRFPICFDVGNRLWVTGGTDGVAAGVQIRHVIHFDDEPDLVWKLEHAITEVGYGGLGDRYTATLYEGRYLRHSRDGHVVLPFGSLQKLFLPFDVGVETTVGRLDGKLDVPDATLEVVRTAALIDLSRSEDFRQRLAIGPAARWDVALDREPVAITQHSVAPFSLAALSAHLESANGITVADLRLEGGTAWHSDGGWHRVVRGEATLERTIIAINDRPVSLVLGARYDSTEWIGQLAARFALFQHRDARVSLKK